MTIIIDSFPQFTYDPEYCMRTTGSVIHVSVSDFLVLVADLDDIVHIVDALADHLAAIHIRVVVLLHHLQVLILWVVEIVYLLIVQLNETDPGNGDNSWSEISSGLIALGTIGNAHLNTNSIF